VDSHDAAGRLHQVLAGQRQRDRPGPVDDQLDIAVTEAERVQLVVRQCGGGVRGVQGRRHAGRRPWTA
jgi:hypothetical protein